jgi:isoleucyl-tRNA synthetase
LRALGYDFKVPLLAGDHVTEEDGTGFVHTAPGHGREDFEIWMQHGPELVKRSIDPAIPFTVDADGRFTKEAPGSKANASSTMRATRGRQRRGHQGAGGGQRPDRARVGSSTSIRTPGARRSP